MQTLPEFGNRTMRALIAVALILVGLLLLSSGFSAGSDTRILMLAIGAAFCLIGFFLARSFRK